MWACWEEAGQSEELESLRTNSRGVGVRKQGRAGLKAAGRQLSGTPSLQAGLTRADSGDAQREGSTRASGSMQVSAGVLQNAFTEIFHSLWFGHPARGRVKPSSECRQHLADLCPLHPCCSFLSHSDARWRPLNCHCWQTETQMGASCQAQAESPAFSQVLN